MSPDEAIGGFFIAIACGIVMGVAVLLLIYKMVDGDLPILAGLPALFMVMLSMALAIHPPHPAVPGVVLVLALALLAFFPYAERVLEEHELRTVDASQMARTFEAVRVRPDNFAAKFELARMLYGHGFQAQAMQLTGTTLAGLPNEEDKITNRSLRDIFHREEILLRRWQSGPQNDQIVKCPSCGAQNEPIHLFCKGCGRPYMLEIVTGHEIKPKVWAKLVLAWAATALFIPGAVAIAMNLTGTMQVLAFAGALLIVGGLLAWLFRRPKHAPAYSYDI